MVVWECAIHIPTTGAQYSRNSFNRNAAKLRSLPLINKVENIATNIASDDDIQII